MSNLREIEFNKVCRTCLSASDVMISLYATDFGLTHLCFAEMLMSFTPLKMSLNDGFPTQICCICISVLNQFHTFQLKCLQSENTLRNAKDKIVHTEKSSNSSEEVLIKKELPIYTDNRNEFEENSTNTVIDQSYTTTKSVQDPLTIPKAQKETSNELDLIKPEFVNIKIEKEDVINTPVSQETTKFPDIHVKSLSTSHLKPLHDINKLAIVEKLYACTVCDRMFADENCLATHKKTHMKEKPYSCTKCNKSFTQNISLLRHIRSHNEEISSDSDSSRSSDNELDHSCAATTTSLEEDPLSIVDIKTDLSQELDLIKHEFIDVKIENEHDIYSSSNSSLVNLSEETSLNETSERPYSCTICDRAFKNKRYLSGHLETHSGKKPYTCTVCNNAFSRKHHLTNHMLIHTGEKQYACTFCDRCFALNGQLTVHLRNHTGEKPYTCTICNSSFKKRCTLQEHSRTHTGETSYLCRFCKKSFEEKKLLNVHLRTHSGNKASSCTECNKSFSSKQHLKYHMLTHTGEKQHACTFCDKCFTVKGQLTAHMRRHTGEKPYTCTICNRSFKGTLKKHLQLHSKNSCTFCDKSFSRSYLLKVHLRTHTGEEPYSCTVCNKVFGRKQHLDNHMVIHTGERPYVCTSCDHSFTRLSALTVHMRTHTAGNTSLNLNSK